MRLIDADRFKNAFNADAPIGETMRLITDEQPTAYDADVVIEKITELQLKAKEKFYNVEDEEYATMLRGWLRGISDCLEIVKSGGVAK